MTENENNTLKVKASEEHFQILSGPLKNEYIKAKHV